MRDLELHDNSLTGNVPDAWGSLVRAAYSMRLALYNNKLTGSIPSSFTDNGACPNAASAWSNGT